MTDVEYCPGCLAELPAGYPYDHVAIDQALAGNRATFAAMDDAERRETVRWARHNGMTDFAISRQVGRSLAAIRRLGDHTTPPVRKQAPKGAHDADIRRLWGLHLSDRAIAAHLRLNPSNVYTVRVRLGLPANHTTSGRRIHHQQEVAA